MKRGRPTDHLLREALLTVGRLEGRTDEANSLSLLVVAAQCEIRSADRQTASSFFPTSLCLLTQRKSALRCCFPSFLLCEFAFLILIASGARASSLARQCKKCGGLQRRERPSFVISLRGLGLSKVDNNMDRAGRSRCNRKRQFWIVDSCGCMAAAGLASGTSPQSFPWALHAYRARQINIQ